MWLTTPNRIGIASWQTEDSVWRLNAQGSEGVTIPLKDSFVGLRGSNAQPLAGLFEQFVREDELHFDFPQPENSDFGYRLVVKPVAVPAWPCSQTRVAFQWLVSVQTRLLDSHPTIDLMTSLDGKPRSIVLPETGSSAYIVESDRLSIAFVLGSSDAPFTEMIFDGNSTRLRLFGQFLEKGVIRRARPWVLIDRSGDRISDETVRDAAETLAGRPLPLS